MASHLLRRPLVVLLAVVLSACNAPLATTTPAPSPVLGGANAQLASPPATSAIPTPLAATPASMPTTVASVAPTIPPAPLPVDAVAAITAAQMPSRDLLALAEQLKGLPDTPPTVSDAPRDIMVGAVETFWISDRATETQQQREFELRYAGGVVLVYVERGVGFDQAALEGGARQFEEQIYRRDRELFGAEWSPGIDGDPRLTVLLADLPGVCGYFSGRDEVPAQVNRYSNQREMFYVNIACAPDGNLSQGSTLAHELQHMIHWNQQRSSPIWFNEGLSTLAEDLNGFVSQGMANAYLRDTDLQLTGWTYQPPRNTAHYGASQLFMRYIYEQYGGDPILAGLIAANAGYDTEQFAMLARQKRPDIASFGQLVGDWAVANLLNDPGVADGRYAYGRLPETVDAQEVGVGPGEGSVAQFGADYLRLPQAALTLHFDGGDQALLLAAQPSGRAAWWSNRGDDSIATLTRELDLSGVSTATLEFDSWYEIETGYDYAFVVASIDGGKSWQTLPGRYTTTDDPQGHSYGNGYTGVSGAPGIKITEGTRGIWQQEQIDLSPYAGRKLLLRFLYVTDDAEAGSGMLIDNIRVPEIGWSDDAEHGEAGWQAEGFVRTGTELPQRWELRLVRQAPSGTRVERLVPDAEGRVSAEVTADEQATLVVVAATRFSGEVAPYSYEVLSR